jgi:hypothetical protein
MAIVHNILSDEIMSKLLSQTKIEDESLDVYFNKENILCINKSLKEGNYYAFDKYGLIIRRKFLNDEKSLYGWTYSDNKEPISIHVDKMLIRTNMSVSAVAKTTFQKLRNKFPAEFKKGVKSTYEKVATHFNLEYMK